MKNDPGELTTLKEKLKQLEAENERLRKQIRRCRLHQTYTPDSDLMKTCLPHNREEMRAILDATQESIFMFDLSGLILVANQTAARRLGFDVNDVVGKHFSVFMSKELAASRQHYLDEVIQSPAPIRFEDVRNGMAFEHNFFPVFEGKQVKAVVAYSRDITRRKQDEASLRQSEERFRMLFETMQQGVVFQDGDGQIMSMNPTAVKILGKTPEEFLGQTSTSVEHDTLHEDGTLFPGIDHPSMVALRSGKVVKDVVMGVYNPREEAYHWINIIAVPQFVEDSPQPSHVYTTFVDITDSIVAKDERRESEEKFRTLADNISQLVWMADETGGLFWFNKRWLDYTGAELKDLEGQGWQSILHSDYRASVIDTFGISVKTGVSWEDTLPLKDKAGNYRWFLFRAFPIKHENGKIVRWFGTHTDITELRQAKEESEALARQLDLRVAALNSTLSAIADAVVIYDLEANIILMSKRARELFGYSEEDFKKPVAVRHKKYMRLENLEGRQLATDDFPVLRTLRGETIIGEIMKLHFDHKTLYVTLTSAPIITPDGSNIGVISTFTDITELKQTEHSLKELTEELEVRVKERTSQLESLNMEMEGIAYSLSHDLRTPLRAIDGFIYLLMDEYGATLDETAKGYIDRARLGAQKAWNQMDAVVNLLKLARAELTMTEVNLSDIAEEIVSHFEETNLNQGVTFKVQKGVLVQGNEMLLTIVLRNLIDNAIKFTGKQKKRVIAFGCQQIKGEIAYFVKDNGIGFDMKYQQKLFTIFQRLHVNEFDGIGLGLASVRHFVLKQGGRVWAEGQEGHGATFYFTLG